MGDGGGIEPIVLVGRTPTRELPRVLHIPHSEEGCWNFKGSKTNQLSASISVIWLLIWLEMLVYLVYVKYRL